MTTKIGGWWRLWITVSILYGVVIIAFAIGSFPKIENIPFEESHLKLLKDSTLKIIVGEVSYKGLPADAVTVKVIEMPNGAKLTVPINTTTTQMQQVAEDYMRILSILVKEQKQSAIIQCFSFWLVPCFSVLMLGFLSRWIYRGFKQNKDSKIN
jgi:hypothetical protein